MTYVMNFEEMRMAAEKRIVVWLERRYTEKLSPLCFNGSEFMGLSETNYLLLSECDEEHSDYNLTYRVWRNMPTQDIRQKTKWRDKHG